jgi:predicted DNA-binding antitoxin AbrB/MazE fold protein
MPNVNAISEAKMTTRFMAVVEQGRLNPIQPVELQEGATVEVVVLSTQATSEPAKVAELLAEIAALPTPGGDPATGRKHDDIIYGGELRK